MTKFIKIIGIISLALLSIGHASAVVTPKASDIQFIENKGQIVDQNYNPNGKVKYLLCRLGFNVQLRATGFSYNTYSDQVQDATNGMSNKKMQPTIAGVSPAADFSRHYHRVDIELLNCNAAAEMIADGRSSASFNYFTAGTPQGGVSDVHSYQRIVYKNIYPFIDLEFTGNDNESINAKDKQPAEYQFIVHPGGRVSDIQLSYSGMNELNLENGQLSVKVFAGAFTEKIPSSYLRESGKKVEMRYVSSGNNVYTFSMAHPFTITSDLVIDPVPCFVWGTYYGGNGWDLGSGIALDASNNVYVAGSTTSTNNIATAGAYQTTFAGGILYDIIVAKFDSSGSNLVWGTYYGGTGSEGENGLAINTSGVYITGFSHSTTLATPGAWQTSCPNCDQTYCDILVAKFSLTGALLWGTYYGTSGYGQGNDIAVNASGVYITGETYGTTGFSTAGAWQTVYGGGLDPFVAKFNLSGSQLLWGTYYGINYNGLPWGICLDTSGNVYIAGYTDGPDTTRITPGAYQTTDSGGYEGFVAKFNPSGSSLLYGTYYGGPGSDIIYGITADASGNVYFTGNTTSSTGIAAGAWQTTNGANNAFVAKLNASGSSLLWGTYYGGAVQEECRSVVLDAANNVYISGGTESTGGIATAGAYQTVLKGSSDAFIAKFNPAGNTLLWGTYYGGNGYDNPPGGTTYLRLGGIALNSANDIYITGFTSSGNGIASAAVWQKHLSAGPDAFVAKFSCNGNPTAAFTASDTIICANSCINLTSLSTNVDSWQSFFQGANPDTSTAVNPQNICYTTAGSYDIKLIVNGAGETDTLLLQGSIQVKAAPPTPTITQAGDTLFSSTDPTYTSYQWYDSTALIPGATDTFLVVTHGGNYNVQVANENGCKVAVGIVLGIDNLSIDKFNIYPNPATNQLTISGLSAAGDKKTLEVFNVLGEQVYVSKIDHKDVTIDVSGFSQGVYYIRLQATGESAVRKFVKE